MSGQNAMRSDDDFASANNKLDDILAALNSLGDTNSSLETTNLSPVPHLPESEASAGVAAMASSVESPAIVPPAVPTMAPEVDGPEEVSTTEPPNLHVVQEPAVEQFEFDVPTFDESSLEEPPPIPCLLYTSPSPRDRQKSRMPSSA